MLPCQVHHQSNTAQTLFRWHKPFVSSDGNGGANSFPVLQKSRVVVRQKCKSFCACYKQSRVTAVATTSSPTTSTATKNSTTVKAVVTVQRTVGATLLLEIVATELDPKTGEEKHTIKACAYRETDVTYTAKFEILEEFGEVGAVLVQNEYTKETYLKNISLHGFHNGTLTLNCNSWVHSKFDNPDKRCFFTNKAYLPSQTPNGVKKLRENELTILRGDGEGERKIFERIYDYDVYNDLGDPDKNDDLIRPILGGKEHPYPRRCRTGRPRSKKDPLSETRQDMFYVPRDEEFSKEKSQTFSYKTLNAGLHTVLPSLGTDTNQRFPYFIAIDTLFKQGINDIIFVKIVLSLRDSIPGFLKDPVLKISKTLLLKFGQNRLSNVLKNIIDAGKDALFFKTPDMMARDKFSWFRDEEFCRQTLAGLNPCSIQLVTEWPLKSKLDPTVYGPPESAITKELVEQEIKSFMTIEEAIKQKKLFILDYHDLLLPYVNKVRELKNTTLYGSRTLMFLTHEGTLRPLAIELTRPPGNGKPLWNKVFKPCWDATGTWLWKLAKAHVLAHDSGYHQLVSHWLRTHCVTEPYIIASNRQLSAMHPIYRLLHPHFRYTMKINALARLGLINANGIIESSFSPGKYSMELCSAAYDLQWRFDHQALPADLISRGMAVEDPTAPYGVKLTIEDYPFASDGLILWDIIKQWVTNYVNHYYPTASLVESDTELQAWWTEIRTVGHSDKKDEPWWPDLKTPEDLIGILTTIIWVTSGHHSAVNFGQYTYAGYFPNRPTIARTKLPCEDPSDDEWKTFKKRPEDKLLSCFPSKIQAVKVMGVLDLLSNHSPDEEYIGRVTQPSWEDNQVIKGAFEVFVGRLKELEGIIDQRNADENLKNRNGAGVVPYELLKPYSEPGVTTKGVPNSISI